MGTDKNSIKTSFLIANFKTYIRKRNQFDYDKKLKKSLYDLKIWLSTKEFTSKDWELILPWSKKQKSPDWTLNLKQDRTLPIKACKT